MPLSSVEAGPAPSGECTTAAGAPFSLEGPVAPVTNSAKRLEIKTYVMLFFMMFFGTAGNALLDRGMKQIGAIELSSKVTVWKAISQTFASGAIWVGIAFMLLYMLCNMLVLSWADYSYVMPFTAISYALVALTGYVWLGERVSLTRWLGIGLIMAGVFLISRTPASTTANTRAGAD